MRRVLTSSLVAGMLWLGLVVTTAVQAQIPTTLTDAIYQGSGSINLLKDVSASVLQQYLTANGGLLLGVDVNENASGNESRDSVGVAIKQLELVLTTSAGIVTFRDFCTSTTAMIREQGAASAQSYYTLFGKVGSSSLTGATPGFDLGALDDVVRVENVEFQGTIQKAQLNVTFLQTAKTTVQGNETFFDFSGGFEDFALLGARDAAILEAANFGTAGIDSSVSYVATAPTVTLASTASPEPAPSPTPSPTPDPAPTPEPSPAPGGAPAPGAPVPPLGLLLAMGALVAWRARRTGSHATA